MGYFRRSFFLFLFVVVYVLPMTVIAFTCARITAALSAAPLSQQTERNNGSIAHQREKNKRKVNMFDGDDDDCIEFIHFYHASLSMSHSEALPTTALILCRVNTPKPYGQLRVKDLPKVLTWRLE